METNPPVPYLDVGDSMGARMPPTGYYSSDYFTAKNRFVAACRRSGWELESLPIDAPSPTMEPLTIDVAVAGSMKPTSAIVVSSGVHGVEGFFGSAVQLALLDLISPTWRPPEGAALILIHALNPFGFAWRRRFNEENVDLNRNFLLPDQPYAGAPPLSAAFQRVLAPKRPPLRFGLSRARLAYLALRHGVRAFWETLPVGQYDFPDWLFFGGRTRAQTVQLVDRLLPAILDETEETIHLDFHTGLGRWGDCQLLLCEPDGTENSHWWQQHFDAELVANAYNLDRPYEARGSLGSWLRARFPNCRYRYATAEFGTYSPAHVIHALADELRWHLKLGPQSPDHWSRRRLLEAFVPNNPQWRATTLVKGLALVQRAMEVLWQPANVRQSVSPSA